MTSDEKIKWVRDRVYELENIGGLGMMTYPLQPVVQEISTDLDDIFTSFFEVEQQAATGKKPKQKVVVITVDEQKEILKRLEGQQLLKILEEREDDFLLEVFPKHPSPLKLKTIEHIARKLADKFTGSEIVDTLIDYGIPRSDIPYPNTKWRTLQELFLTLATSPNPELREKFLGAITTFLHPLNFNADESASHELIEDFNKYLKYDGYEIVAAEDGEGYVLAQSKNKTKVGAPAKQKVGKETHNEEEAARASPSPKNAPIPKQTEAEARDEYESEYSDGVEREIEILRAPKNAESLAVMREAYKTLMAIASSFCVDPTTPSRELNAAYTQLAYSVRHELEETYCGDKTPFSTFRLDIYKDDGFGIPFYDLYSAELTFKRKGRALHWDEVRPAMNAMLGQIEDLCDTANAPDVISEPEVQKVISDAMLLLSEIAATRKKEKGKENKEVLQMNIMGMPPIQLKSDKEQKSGLYITREKDDFLYKGKHLKLSPKANYYRVFSALYSLIPKGGEVSYKDLIGVVKKSIRKVEDKSDAELRKFIQRNLTDKSNGFLRFAGIPEMEDNGKPLLSVVRGSGITFNNGTG